MTIEGYTDSKGAPAVNLQLARVRDLRKGLAGQAEWLLNTSLRKIRKPIRAPNPNPDAATTSWRQEPPGHHHRDKPFAGALTPRF